MGLRMVMKLCFYILLYERVRSSACSFLENQTLLDGQEVDNVLEKFFVEFKKAYLQEFEFRHITIVGTTTNYLHQFDQPLFANYPSIICADTKKCDYQEQFSRGNFVIVFLDDLKEDTFGKNFNLLSRCRKCRVLFISDGVRQVQDVWLIFTLAMQYDVLYAEFAQIGKNFIQLYSNFVARNCSMGVRPIVVWRPGVHLEKIESSAFRLRDLNGCPVLVSSFTFQPKMIIKENKNGSLIISGGLEGKLLLALAAKLNFTINLKYPSVVDQMTYSRKAAIINDVASGISDIGIGRLRPIRKLNKTVELSVPYDEECVTWGVPRIMKWSNGIVWVEFSWKVWASVGLTFGVSCVIGSVYRSISSLKNGEQTRQQGFVKTFLDAVAIHLGHPVSYIYSSAGGRFVLMAYLYYAMVMTTAYKTSLASILATDESTPRIVDALGIINANFNVGGSSYDYTILKDQVTESKLTSKLLERFVMNNNDSETLNQLMIDQDYALLAQRSSLNYEGRMIMKAHKPVTFNIFNSCVLAYHAVIAFQKRSFLRQPVNDIIMRLAESGILGHWDIDKFDVDKMLKRKGAEMYFEERATHKFRYIFILYSGCIVLCLGIFLIELLVHKLDSIRM